MTSTGLIIINVTKTQVGCNLFAHKGLNNHKVSSLPTNCEREMSPRPILGIIYIFITGILYFQIIKFHILIFL